MYALSSNFSQVIPMFLQFYRYSLSVTTKPSYTTTKEQNHISHMGIRTPCYTTIKEQNHISHMDIRTPSYTTTKEQNHITDTHVTNMILFFCCSIAWFCCYR
jgi:hypothetical protein